MILNISNTLFIYTFYVFIIRKTFSAKQKKLKWSYTDCRIFINDLDIICTNNNFSKDLNGTNICKDWTINNQSNIIYLPEECANKIYTIEDPINNFINPIQKNFKISITNNYIIPKKYASNANKYKNINNCMKVCTTFVKKCTLEEDYENCKKVKKKLNLTDFCINTILETIEVFQNRVESLINQSETNFFQEASMIMPKTLSKEKKEVRLFQNLESLNDKKLNIFGENEPKKDCVEYGLKSINEEILVCLKYE